MPPCALSVHPLPTSLSLSLSVPLCLIDMLCFSMKCKPLNLTCCSVRPAAISSMHVLPRWERCKSNLYKYFTSVFPRSQLLSLKLSHLCCQNNYMLTKQLGGKHNKNQLHKITVKDDRFESCSADDKHSAL